MSKTIDLEQIPVIKELVRNEIEGNTLSAMVSITYADLVAKVNAGELVPGQQYRITDYVTTTVQNDTQSAGHAFDIIVTADSADTLNKNARAALHEGDTYFANSDLSAWRLKYDINNDTTICAWADETNGKGVIYEMEDEFGNRCGYDFKNIQFKLYKITAMEDDNLQGIVGKYVGAYVYNTTIVTPEGATLDATDTVWRYTFTNSPNYNDHSLNIDKKKKCYDNTIAPLYGVPKEKGSKQKQFLNYIILCPPVSSLYSNHIGVRSFNSYIGEGGVIYRNNIHGQFYRNVILGSASENTLEASFSNNIFMSAVTYNTFNKSFTNNIVKLQFSGNIVNYAISQSVLDSELDEKTFLNNADMVLDPAKYSGFSSLAEMAENLKQIGTMLN